jgi:hypothetical protein
MDKVASKADEKSHLESYGHNLHKILNATFQRGTRNQTNNPKPSMERNLVMLCCHICDQSRFLTSDQKEHYDLLLVTESVRLLKFFLIIP